MVSDAQMRAKSKYESKAYSKILLRVRKDSGQLEQIREYCEKYGVSVNSAFVNALMYCIENDINLKK